MIVRYRRKRRSERRAENLILTIIGIYLAVGFIANIACVFKEPLLVYAWWLAPIGILVWPWLLWAVFTSDNTGRWI
jgi:hypothetical protein